MAGALLRAAVTERSTATNRDGEDDSCCLEETAVRESKLEIRPNAVYTLAEVCQILGVSDATMRRWIKTGKIHAPRVGRAYRLLGSQLLAALEHPRAA
jgi:excisionase family DNA binding protein